MRGKHLGPLYLFKNIKNMTKEDIAIYLANNSGVSIISEERNRQITHEGYDWKQDDSYQNEELALAATVYALPPEWRGVYAGANGHSNMKRVLWPWDHYTFKPVPSDNSTVIGKSQSVDNRIKELAKAGALIAAEIDRLQRFKIKAIYGKGSIDNEI